MINHQLAFEQAKAHARDRYPEESCGFIVKDTYVPLRNHAADPATHVDDPACACRLCSFAISPDDYLAHESGIQMILHSHPDGPNYPSARDMQSQLATNVAWGIIVLDEERIGDPIVWGGDTPIAPILGRQFVHGIHDCYSLIRDTFALGREALAKQDIDWPFDPIQLMEVPRDDAWWAGDFDLYETEGIKAGFTEIDAADVRPGDGFLMKIKSEKFNHGGLLLPNNLILHHLPARLSRREPAGLWARNAGKWMRYTGPRHA